MSSSQYTAILDRLQEMGVKVARIENKLDRALYEDGIDPGTVSKNDITKEDILSKGTRIPYNRIYLDRDVANFKTFLHYIATHARDYTSQEIDYARFADKGFNDVRLSDNHMRILRHAYMKTHGQDWNFTIQQGYMYKYLEQIEWDWPE